jgi:transposase-like protein
MTCIRCTHGTCRKFGYYGKRRIQRWRCQSSRATFSQPVPKLGTHYTDPETAAKVLTLMLEGMSVRAISRFTGMHKHTILLLMLTASEKAHQVLNANRRRPTRY